METCQNIWHLPADHLKAHDRNGCTHTAVVEVMGDFVRLPMTPATAQLIADVFGCQLPTRKLVDEIHRKAAVKLAQQPLTENREAVETFVRHHTLIGRQ